ncbi:GlxA family transcriptional regulator [Ralstonia sp. ASV6]|uniref:GlxA family transcriptional regulator n=1 Tax=Ralstonia sp. ASV6 TaxID=2795124 RepID=UPI0018EB28C0|nr:helix-turn-helix domain-containing protein [Ralstonia sp. ASV6]
MRRVFFVVLPHVHMLDLGGPMQVLESLAGLGIASVPLRCVGPRHEVTSAQGAALTALHPLPKHLERGDVVIVIGSRLALDTPVTPEQLEAIAWLQTVVAPRLPEITLASVCTGAFLLGAAGLLDGRHCTTHHDYLERLQKRYPAARVLPNRLLLEDAGLITSAGVSAGIDLALLLIVRHFGEAAAIRVARENVVPFRRLGHDPALDAQLRYRNHGHPVIHAVQDFLTAQPASTLPYEALASRFAVSYRHLARLFQQECGVTLKQYQQQLRIAMARRLLKGGDWPVERVAEACGFASPQAFRAAWRQEESVPPARWRAQA